MSTASRGRGCFGGRPPGSLHGALGQPAVSFRDYLKDTSRRCFSVACVSMLQTSLGEGEPMFRRNRVMGSAAEERCPSCRQTLAHAWPHPRSETPGHADKGGRPEAEQPLMVGAVWGDPSEQIWGPSLHTPHLLPETHSSAALEAFPRVPRVPRAPGRGWKDQQETEAPLGGPAAADILSWDPRA